MSSEAGMHGVSERTGINGRRTRAEHHCLRDGASAKEGRGAT